MYLKNRKSTFFRFQQFIRIFPRDRCSIQNDCAIYKWYEQEQVAFSMYCTPYNSSSVTHSFRTALESKEKNNEKVLRINRFLIRNCFSIVSLFYSEFVHLHYRKTANCTRHLKITNFVNIVSPPNDANILQF